MSKIKNNNILIVDRVGPPTRNRPNVLPLLDYSFVPDRQTGLFVKTAAYFAYRFVCCVQVRLFKKKDLLANQCRPQQAWCIWAIIVAHSSVRVYKLSSRMWSED